MLRTSWRLTAALSMLGVAACRPEFQLKNFTTNDVLYKASLAEYQRHHWDNAISGFEKLTTDLPARDTLLPRSYWYLASSHQHQDELLLAAQSFERLVESFPEDSLADDAGLDAARSYRRLWRKPGLDSKYGEQALASYNTLIGLYPTSPLVAVAQTDKVAHALCDRQLCNFVGCFRLVIDAVRRAEQQRFYAQRAVQQPLGDVQLDVDLGARDFVPAGMRVSVIADFMAFAILALDQADGIVGGASDYEKVAGAFLLFKTSRILGVKVVSGPSSKLSATL